MTVNLLGEMIVSEAIGNVDICAMIETEGSLLTQLTVTFTIQGGTASNNIVHIIIALKITVVVDLL